MSNNNHLLATNSKILQRIHIKIKQVRVLSMYGLKFHCAGFKYHVTAYISQFGFCVPEVDHNLPDVLPVIEILEQRKCTLRVVNAQL